MTHEDVTLLCSKAVYHLMGMICAFGGVTEAELASKEFDAENAKFQKLESEKCAHNNHRGCPMDAKTWSVVFISRSMNPVLKTPEHLCFVCFPKQCLSRCVWTPVVLPAFLHSNRLTRVPESLIHVGANCRTKLDKNLGHDYGPKSAFLPLLGKCVEVKVNQYTYELCPYEKATQKEGCGLHHLVFMLECHATYTLLRLRRAKMYLELKFHTYL